MANDEAQRYMETRKRVEQRRALQVFLAHLTIYIIANSFLGVWNTLTYQVKDNPTIWFPIPLLFWGVGVVVHFWVSVVLFERWWERDEKAVRRRLDAAAGEGPPTR